MTEKAAKEIAAAVRPRRSALQLMMASAMSVGFAALAAAAGLWAAAVARFLMPNAIAAAPRRLQVGLPADYREGYVETKYQQQGVWVVRGVYRGRRQIYALRTVCTHLGCITLWDDTAQKFKCPCHGSGFHKDGVNFEGPAPRPLERCAIRLADDGQLEIDCGRTFREELGQWRDPASYVEVRDEEVGIRD